MLDRIFHVNICVRDMERSVRFLRAGRPVLCASKIPTGRFLS